MKIHFIARKLNDDGTVRLGTLDCLAGDYASQANFYRYMVKRFAKPGDRYEVEVFGNGWQLYQKPTETKYILVTRDGSIAGAPKNIIMRGMSA